MLQKPIYYMLISTLAFTLLNVFVKMLDRFDVTQIIFFRSFGSVFFTTGFLLRYKIAPLGNKKALLFLRSVVGLLSLGLFFAALKELQTGSAVSLRYVSPIFAMFFAVLLLKEKIKPIQWLFISIAFAGILMIKGFSDAMSNYGLFLIISSALFSGLVFIVIRKIGDADHPVVVVHYFMVFSAIVSGVLSIFYWETPIGIEWLILISLGVFGYFGQLYMTKAFRSSQMNLVAPLKYLEVFFTLTLGFIWLDEKYTFWSIAGILLVLVGLVLNTLYKTQSKNM